MMDINKDGLELIKHFEGLKLEAYLDSAGVWTIGYGHTTNVKQGMRISEQQALEFLKRDLATSEHGVSKLIKVSLNEDQFSALVSFTFNLGVGNLQYSTLRRLLNNGDYMGASQQFVRWSKAGGKRLAGLVKRRLSERNLFRSKNPYIVTSLPSDWESRYLEL